MDELKALLDRQNEIFSSLVDRITANQPAQQRAGSSQPVPQPPPLCLDGDMDENFDFFQRNWENYAEAIGMNQWSNAENKKKVSFLLSIIGFDALKKYFNFQLTEEQRQSPEAALAAIKVKVIRPRNINLDLLEFLSVKQESESIDEFLTKLKVLVQPCQLGNLEDRFVTYKIVTSNKWPHLRKKLVTMKDVTIDKAVDECKLEEVSARRIQELGDEAKMEVNKVKLRNEREEKQCKFCGGRHVFVKGSCPAYGQKCRRCKGKNHFEKMCRKSESLLKKQKRVKEVKDRNEGDCYDSSESESRSEFEESDYEREIGKIYNNAASGGHVLAEVWLRFQDRWKQVKCELDTGANTSLIGYDWLRKLCGDREPVLLPSKYKLQHFGGGTIPVLGEFKVPCRHKEQKFKLVFQVVDVEHRPLFSAKVCETLGLVKFCNSVSFNRSGVPDDPLKIFRIEAHELARKYDCIFHGYGKIGGAVSLEVDRNVPPQIQQPRRIPIALRGKLRDELDKLEADGIIVKEPRHTDWVSNILLVNRSSSGESFRICLDPVPLNKALKRPNLQFLTLDEVLPELGKAKVFSTVDAKKGFWHVELDEPSSLLTTFWTPYGRYRWTRLPFGISSAPEIFQMKLREVIEGLDGIECLADDLLIFGCGETIEEAVKDHHRRLAQLFARLKQHNVKLNRSKMNLCQTSVKFFGHILSENGLRADDSKLSAIQNFPSPKDRKELLRFVGMINYLGRFIPNLRANLVVLRGLLSEKKIHGAGARKKSRSLRR